MYNPSDLENDMGAAEWGDITAWLGALVVLISWAVQKGLADRFAFAKADYSAALDKAQSSHQLDRLERDLESLGFQMHVLQRRLEGPGEMTELRECQESLVARRASEEEKVSCAADVRHSTWNSDHMQS